ncbi:MAG: HEAT repeat domain-containing protein [Nitrosopumilus sp.]|nr:HEAT repeat domain-containing protein [Nitrosopumilus sp.]
MEDILKILEAGESIEKIKILETLEQTDDPVVLEKIISRLNDDDIQVRGEAFSSLLLNKNSILEILIKNLNSTSENIRGYTSLVLANRNEGSSIPEIMKLVKDERAIVRSCALGALGHLRAQEAEEIFLNSLSDSNIDVRKSALQAIIELDILISEKQTKQILKEKDHEIKKMISKLRKSGPEGI